MRTTGQALVDASNNAEPDQTQREEQTNIRIGPALRIIYNCDMDNSALPESYTAHLWDNGTMSFEDWYSIWKSRQPAYDAW